MDSDMQHIVYTEVDQKTFNSKLDESDGYVTHLYPFEQRPESETHQGYHRYINDKTLYITLTYKIGGQWRSYKTNKAKVYDEGYTQTVVDPIRAYTIFSRVVKPVKIPEVDRDKVHNIGGYTDFHPDKKGHYVRAICYDVNKSFFNACKNMMPTTIVDKYCAPKLGEVGFPASGIPVIGPSDHICYYVFKLDWHDGLRRYVDLYSQKLKKATDPNVRRRLKDEINLSIGNLAHHNPFLRNMIVWWSNEFIKSKVDDNTIWSNTDSIVSSVPRPDLEIGDDVGQFKIEHDGEFIQNVTGYQWVTDHVIRWKGVSQDRIKIFEKKEGRQFLIDRDDLSTVQNLYIFDYGKQKLKKVGR